VDPSRPAQAPGAGVGEAGVVVGAGVGVGVAGCCLGSAFFCCGLVVAARSGAAGLVAAGTGVATGAG
jgi:hypothetical protein